MRRLILVGIMAALAPSVARAQADEGSRPKKGLSLGQVAESQKDPEREKLEASVRLLRTESYAQAAAQLHQLLASDFPYQEEAQYNLAKSLYRMGLLHSALHYFSGLLSKGPKGRYYNASLEWCLFIGRKMVDDGAVNELVARFAQGDFPEEYRDEFYFRLARFHYVRGLAIETGEVAGALGETDVGERKTGGLSVSGDIFGDDPFAEPKKEEPQEEEEDPSVKKKGGGLSIDEDIFGFGDEGDGKKKKDKKKGKDKKEEAKPKPAPAPVKAPPPAEAADGKLALTPKEHFEAARRFVVRVKDGSDFGARARFLEALLAYKDGKENDALKAFKEVVKVAGGAEDDDEDEAAHLKEAAFFQLARTHFGAQQPTFSIFYYAKVDRDSYQWLDALYEASWAHFRLGNYEKALGNLLTVHAPFFHDLYYPESHILKAVIYYENCRYPEAKDILTGFMKRYEPVLKELERLSSEPQNADEYYKILQNLQSDEFAEGQTQKGEILAQVLGIALSDPELKRLDASYKEVSDELTRVEKDSGIGGSGLGAELLRVLGEERTVLGRNAGRAVKNQLQRERGAIKDLIQQAIRIDIETSRSEQERIESQLREVQSRPKEVEKEFVEWADDEKYVWPFEGEYWRDELGTYELTLAHSCR
jgi:tetratricopeptide (TPR) repeat protein